MNKIKGATHQGIRDNDDGQTAWCVFPRDLFSDLYNGELTRDKLEEVFDLIPPNWCAFSGGPGQMFSHGPSVWRGRNRVLVTITTALDV